MLEKKHALDIASRDKMMAIVWNNIVKCILGGLVENLLRVESELDARGCCKRMDDLDLEFGGSLEEHVDVILSSDDDEKVHDVVVNKVSSIERIKLNFLIYLKKT